MALTQSHFRFGENSGTESTHPFLAAEDTAVSREVGAAGQFLLRICVQNDAAGAANNLALQWQYRRLDVAGGDSGWLDVTTTSAVVRTGATAVFTNGANCTQRLSGTGTFEASGAGCTHDGTSGGAANDVVASGNTETLIGLQLIAADVDMEDRVQLRVVQVGGTPLGAYTAVPEVTVLPQTQALLAQGDNGPGLLQTGTRTTGPRPPARLRVDFPMSAATRDDPATTFTAGIQRFAGGQWVHDFSLSFVGGTTNPKTGLPREAFLWADGILPDTDYRGFLDLPATYNIGAILSW